jgi:hypothetical protein
MSRPSSDPHPVHTPRVPLAVAIYVIAIIGEFVEGLVRVRASPNRRVRPFRKTLVGAPEAVRRIGVLVRLISAIAIVVFLVAFFRGTKSWAYLLLPAIWAIADLPPILIHNARIDRAQHT